MDYLIFTGGSIDPVFAADYLKKNRFQRILAVDKGIETADRLHIPVDVLLGDFDSASEGVLEEYFNRPGLQVVRHNPIKDQTDTELAVRYALEHHASAIHILGGTGTRIDHMLGTIHSMKPALDQKVECVIVDSHNRIRLLGPGCHRIKRQELFGGFLSLIPLTEQVTGVNLTGMKYPLTDAVFTIGNSLGISNEVVDEEASVAFRDGILVQIESRD